MNSYSRARFFLSALLFAPVIAFTQVDYSPNPLDFGSRSLDEKALSKNVWINNNTDKVLTVYKAEVICSEDNIYGEQWSGTIEPHSKNFLEVWWRPTVRGINKAYLLISHSFSEHPDTVEIKAVSTLNLTFWSGLFEPQFLDVLPNDISTGILTLDIDPIGSLITVTSIKNKTTAFEVVDTSFVFGGAKSIGIEFTPPDTGTYYDTLTIYSDATNSPTLYPVEGTCIPSYFSYGMDLIEFPDLSADEDPFTNEILALKIKYSSEDHDQIIGKLKGNGAYRFENGLSDSTIQFNLNGSSELACSVIFDPATPGDHNEPLIFTYNGYGSPDTVMLKGLGIPSCLSADQDTLFFSDINRVEVSCKQIAINYTGASSIKPGEPIEVYCKLEGNHSFTVNSDSVYRYFISGSDEELSIALKSNMLGSSEANLIIYTAYGQISADTVKLIEKGFGNFTTPPGIADDPAELPTQFSLFQNFPNPFNPSTIIRYALPYPGEVRIEVFNSVGQRLWSSDENDVVAGYHEIEFNAQNLPSGIYFYRIETAEFQAVKKMILLR